MKKHGMRCELAIAGALLFCTGSSALAQAGPQLEKYRYLTLDYQKTEPGKARDYVQLEKEYYKPLHQERVNLGRIISWRLYAVNFPNGDRHEYDFVVLTDFGCFAHMDSSYAGWIVAKSSVNPSTPKSDQRRRRPANFCARIHWLCSSRRKTGTKPITNS